MYYKSMAILPENETTEFENRTYINPEVSLNEQMSFIDNLRANQKERNAEINQQTYNLGTSVPSNLGGLTGGQGYWTSRYQTPQTASAVADLRATAQAQALNDILANEQAKWKKRYNDAYNAAKVRASNTGGGDGSDEPTEGGVDKENNAGEVSTDFDYEASNGDKIVYQRDGSGNLTGREYVIHPDGTTEWRDSTYSHDVGRAAGMSEFLDLFTGKYNYTIDGTEIELGGNDENLVKGSDGNYYIWNKVTNRYTPINTAQGSTPGGGKWWMSR